MHLRFLALAALSITFCGCSGRPGRIGTPEIDPSAAAHKAIEELDSSGDGLLSAAELRACPALAHAAPSYDTSGDGSLGQEEIEAGISRWASSRTGAIMLPFRVQLNGRPLENAEVQLIPVSFVEESLKPAVGKANDRGSGMLGLAPDDRPSGAPDTPLVPPGLYRVEIRHPSISVPSQFNSESILGVETYVAAQNPAGIIWDLDSKKN